MTPEEKAKQLGVPVIPPLPNVTPDPSPNPTVAVCGKCGIELKQVMHFACPHSDCPCQLKPRCSNAPVPANQDPMLWDYMRRVNCAVQEGRVSHVSESRELRFIAGGADGMLVPDDTSVVTFEFADRKAPDEKKPSA